MSWVRPEGPTDDEAARLAAMGDLLRQVGFDEAGVLEVLEADGLPAGRVPHPAATRHRARGGSPREVLVRVFFAGEPVDPSTFAGAVVPIDLDDWLASGLVRIEGDHLVAGVLLRLSGGFLLASDARALGAVADDFVMGLSASTVGLARLTVRRPVEAALDLACGGGFQALCASSHARLVVATDVNPRAVAMARFNAALNGVHHLEVRQGDLFEPVADDTFDLVVSNPPFVIGPDIRHQFLSTERVGDTLSEEVARGVVTHLREGGYGQFLANWMVRAGQRWSDPLDGWFAGAGADVWVMQSSCEPVDEYASTWIGSVTDDAAEYQTRFDAWMELFAESSVERIGFGLVTVRRRSGGPAVWRRYDEVGDLLALEAGDDLGELVESHTWARSVTDEELLASVVRVSPVARADLRMEIGPGGWQAVEQVLTRVSGLPFGTPATSDLLRLAGLLDGSRTVADALAELTSPLDPDVTEAALGSLRELVSTGLLVRP